jgi:hypothetical protein
VVDRQTGIRLLVGAVVAMTLHALLLPALGRQLTRSLSLSAVQKDDAHGLAADLPHQPDEPPPRQALGRRDAPDTASLAWIAYEDFQQLVGLRAQTLQPVVQELADPVPEAPVVVDATPPAPVFDPAPRPDSAASSPTEPTWQPVAGSAPDPLLDPLPPSPQIAAEGSQDDGQPFTEHQATAPMDGDSPADQAEMLPPPVADLPDSTERPQHAEHFDDPPPQTLVQAESEQASMATPTVQQHARSDILEQADRPLEQRQRSGQAELQTPSSAAASTSPADDAPAPERAPRTAAAAPAQRRPTVAPRDDREVDPSEPNPRDREIRPGQVVTTRGIEIKTAAVRISTASRLTAVPRRAVARISFDRDGSVRHAELLRSTGYADIDAALVASFYRWRAVGIENEDGFTEQFTIVELTR